MAYLQPLVPEHAAMSQRRIGLVVLGVGRSGTSVLTRCFNLLGAALPQTLIGPGEGNTAGHWEPAQLVFLNHEILRLHEQTWLDARPIPSQWFASPAAHSLAGRIASIIAVEYGRSRLFVLKDPRICRLLPLYRKAFDMLDIAMGVVLPLRHPAAVAASIARRDTVDTQAGERVWVHDLLASEAASRDIARVWTRYDALLADPKAVLSHIGRDLGLQWPVPLAAAGAAIEACIDPSLRHFQADGSQSCTPLVERLWEVAQLGLTGQEAALRWGFDTVRTMLGAIGDAAPTHA